MTFCGVTGITVLLYSFSFPINVLDPLWNHRNISASLNSVPALVNLFTRPQADGFYRPLSFLSLWADYRIFGEHLWGYHIQNLILHILNAALVFALALSLSFSYRTARWAAWLYAAAAVNFEAVMWPAARFDLVATLFILIALLAFLRFAKSPTWQSACACTAAYAIALLNKETAYAFPLLAATILATHLLWELPKPNLRALAPLAILISVTTAFMLAIRIAVFGNLGGYPASVAHSAHFTLQGRTLWSLINRVMLIPLLGVNTTSPLLPFAAIAIGLFVAFVLAAIFLQPRTTNRVRMLLALALVSALPVANIAGWIGPSMQHARYLYFPTLFLFIAIAAAFAEARHGQLLLGLLLCANGAGTLNNLWAYRNVQGSARELAAAIHHDAQREHAAAIELIGVPREPRGVFYFYSELNDRLRQGGNLQVIDTPVEPAAPSPEPANRLIYRWDPEKQILHGPTIVR